MGDSSPESKRAYRKRHHEQGLCTYCVQPAAPGFLTCERHLALNKTHTESWRRRQREKGLCSVCTKPRWGTSIYCLKHREMSRLQLKTRRWRRKVERLRSIREEVTHAEPR